MHDVPKARIGKDSSQCERKKIDFTVKEEKFINVALDFSLQLIFKMLSIMA